MTTANKNTWKYVIIELIIFLSLLGVSLLFQQHVLDMNWYVGGVLFGIFAMVEGFNESYTDFYKAKSNSDHNGHIMFRVNTGIVILLLSKFVDWYSIGCYVLMYSFLHDGIYYWNRNNLTPGVYTTGFMDFTKTPIAISDKIGLTKPYIRAILFAVGAVALIIINYVNR